MTSNFFPITFPGRGFVFSDPGCGSSTQLKLITPPKLWIMSPRHSGLGLGAKQHFWSAGPLIPSCGWNEWSCVEFQRGSSSISYSLFVSRWSATVQLHHISNNSNRVQLNAILVTMAAIYSTLLQLQHDIFKISLGYKTRIDLTILLKIIQFIIEFI